MAAEERRREAARKRQLQQARLDHVAAQQDEAECKNELLAARLAEITGLLATALASDIWRGNFEELKRALLLPPFDTQALSQAEPLLRLEDHLPKPPSFLLRLLPGSSGRHQAALEAGRRVYEAKVAEHAAREQERLRRLADLTQRHQALCARLQREVEEQNAQIDTFAAAYRAAEPSAVVRYFETVLDLDVLPEGFSPTFRVAFTPESKQLVVERELPTPDVVPVRLCTSARRD